MGSCVVFNETASTEIYTLSLHDALQIEQGCEVKKKAVNLINDRYFGNI